MTATEHRRAKIRLWEQDQRTISRLSRLCRAQQGAIDALAKENERLKKELEAAEMGTVAHV